jgi:AraC-like DNA-binding protein
MPATVSSSLFAEVGRAAEKMGYRPPVVLPGRRRLFERRLPLAALSDFLTDLERESGDAAIGLRLGRLLGPAAFGIAGYIAMAGPTLIEALPRVIGYQRLVADGLSLRATIDAGTVRMHLEYATATTPRALSDLFMAGVRCFGAWLLGCEPPLSQVSFRYGQPADTTLHEEVFGCMPQFGAVEDGFTLDLAWFHAPLRTGEPSLAPLLEAQAARLLGALRNENFVTTVSQMIVDLLPAGTVGITAVADGLHASPRTVQRRLQAHGLTFNRLLQEVRMDLANRYLADREISLQDIAGRLGYSEHSSFCHAYRQWTGRPPSAVRGKPAVSRS